MNHLSHIYRVAAFVLLQALPVALAYGEDTTKATAPMAMNMSHGQGAGCGMNRPMVMKDMEDFPEHPSYFLHQEHTGLMLAHISLMILAWVVVLPLAVMLSISRSRLTLPSHLMFLILNGIGILVSIIYRAQVPNLYEANAHHKIGWIVTCLAGVWAALAVLHLYTNRGSRATSADQGHAISESAMVEHSRFPGAGNIHAYRWSEDSGNGTLRNSSRANSWNTDPTGSPTKRKQSLADDDDLDAHASEEKVGLLQASLDNVPGQHVPPPSSRTARIMNTIHFVLERSMIPLMFLSLLTGIVTYSGISREGHIFNVIAHLIKGGIFFVYGQLTFGRWMGCFSELGWAWNLKPGAEVVGRRNARVPSAEWVESFVICFYGTTNVFLEHLGAWGKQWTAMDFEHVSITIMFAFGGLLGMLIESPRIRNFLSNTLDSTSTSTNGSGREREKPRSYDHPLNPIPSLVILLLGIMMSNHTQHSLISGQIHRQWGLLFAGFALARSLTYVTMWLKPPTTYLPTRPPTELLASFCLIAGGSIFMASNKDTINALEEYHLDSMFVFTVMMGLTCLVMAWELFVIAFKGWAVRQQLQRAPYALPTSPA